MKYFIDTNIFLRVLIQDLPDKAKDCIDLLKLIKTNKLEAITSSIVYAEIAWTLKSYYKIDRKSIAESLELIHNLNGINISNNFDEAYASKLLTKYNVKYIDCLISSIESITDKNCIVVSYDKDFDTLGVKRIEPYELINKYE